MPGRFRRRRDTPAEPPPDGEPRRPLTGRRWAPTPGALRRERRALLRARDERIRDLGGLMLEMYRRDHYREELVFEQCAELVELEERILALDALVSGAVRWPIAAGQCTCGAPIVPTAHFCANCGRPAGEPLVGCPQCGHPLAADAQFCPGCGTSALGFAGPGALEADVGNGFPDEIEPGAEGSVPPLDPWER